MSAVEVWTPSGSAMVRRSGYEPVSEIEATDEARTAVVDLAYSAVRSSTGRLVWREDGWHGLGDP